MEAVTNEKNNNIKLEVKNDQKKNSQNKGD